MLPPIGLIVLSLIPVIAGAVRLTELLGGPQITANNARFVDSPIPVTVHIVSVTLYSLLAALQFVALQFVVGCRCAVSPPMPSRETLTLDRCPMAERFPRLTASSSCPATRKP